MRKQTLWIVWILEVLKRHFFQLMTKKPREEDARGWDVLFSFDIEAVPPVLLLYQTTGLAGEPLPQVLCFKGMDFIRKRIYKGPAQMGITKTSFYTRASILSGIGIRMDAAIIPIQKSIIITF